MTTIKAAGTLLAADTGNRTLTYRLLPYGSPGRTSVGTVTVSAGAVQVPEDVSTLTLNEEHDYTRPIGRFSTVTDDDDGLHSTITVSKTRAGDDALILAREGLRTGISVELDDAVIQDGRLVSARLTGAGLVVRPAFADAQLITAADTNPTEKKEPMPGKQNGTQKDSQNDQRAGQSGQLPDQPGPIHASTPARHSLGRITMDALAAGAPGQVSAALTDLKTTDDQGKVYIRDQEVGELWEARKTERPIIQSIGVKPLTSLLLVGKRKKRTFKVADWAGNKADMPTGKFTTSQETWKASAKAVAVDVALELIEFGSEDVMADLWSQAMDSYIEQTEAEVVKAMLDGATATPGTVDVISGVSSAAQAFATMGASMTAIAVAPDVYGKLLTIPTAQAPWWFGGQATMDLAGQSFSGAGIKFSVSESIPTGQVMVYDRRAVDYRESRDIRLSAVNVGQGGYDLAFAKFRATHITDPAAILVFNTVSAG